MLLFTLLSFKVKSMLSQIYLMSKYWDNKNLGLFYYIRFFALKILLFLQNNFIKKAKALQQNAKGLEIVRLP